MRCFAVILHLGDMACGELMAEQGSTDVILLPSFSVMRARLGVSGSDDTHEIQNDGAQEKIRERPFREAGVRACGATL